MADFESESRESYSSFLVTIGLSRLGPGNMGMRQTDRRTTRTITIAGPHITAGQLINENYTQRAAQRH